MDATAELMRQWLTRNTDKLIPLARLFAMPHPANVGNAQFSMSGNVSEAELAYYAECLTLGPFLIEKEGPRFLGKIEEALA